MDYPLEATLRTPLHERALCLADVRPTVRFIRVFSRGGIERGMFLSEPNMESDWPYADVRMMTPSGDKFNTKLFLDDAGIIPYEYQGGKIEWGAHYTLSADDELLIPKHFLV